MSMPLRVLVCDDEMIARKRAVRLLSDQAGLEIVAECTSGDEVLEKLRSEEIDVIVLDINMPNMTGLETAMRMPEDRPYIIFLTAHPEHALEAFDVGAMDYLLKPVDAARMQKALDRARKQLDPSGQEPPSAAPLARLAIETKTGVVLLSLDDVTHASFDGQLVTVHTKDRTVLTDQSL